MPKGYFNKLEGHDGYSIMDPLLTPEDIVSDPNIIFNANARKLYKGSVNDKYKPYYGYILKAGQIIAPEDLQFYNENLTSYAALEHERQIMGYYVRIPYIHGPSIMDPEVVEDRKVAESLIRSHTFCTVDPTRINKTIKIEPKTLVKLHFTDNNYSKGRIIGVSAGVGGGVLGSVLDAILRGPGVGGGIDCTNQPPFSPVTGTQYAGIILGASVGPTLQAQLNLDGVSINLASPRDGIASCPLALQEGGKTNAFFLEQADKVLANPQELAKYVNYKYVFVNSPNGNDFAAYGRHSDKTLLAYAKREKQRGSAQQLYDKLNKIFPGANGVFYTIKGSIGWGPMTGLTKEGITSFYEIAGYKGLFRILKAQMIKEHHGDKSAIRDTVNPNGSNTPNLSQQIKQIVNGGGDSGVIEE